jgi:glycosyltransferase involved in cell wall biosynthesis
VSSLLIATSHYTYRHPLYSRNRAMIEYLQRSGKAGFSRVTVLYPDHISGRESPSLRILEGGLEELRFSLYPLRGEHPALEPGYASSKIVPYFQRKKLHYDYCLAADLTGWQVSFPLRRLGYVSCLVYDDQDYFPRVIKNPQGRLTSSGLENIIARTADRIISASETLAELRRSQGAKNVRVIPNGVDPSFYRSKESNSEERLARQTIIYAGSMDRDYGVSLLVEAFSSLVEKLKATLMLAGVGPLSKSLAAEFEYGESGPDVRLLGPVEHWKLPELFQKATVGVAPYLEGSSAAYGIPMKIKEYLASGMPVVATNVGEIGNFLDENVGIVVSPNVGELVEALTRVLSFLPDRYSSMSLAARKLVEGYSWDDLCKRYLQFILDSCD